MAISEIGNFVSGVTNGGYLFRRKMNVYIETVAACNLSCTCCPSANDKFILKRKRPFLSDEDFHKIIDLTKSFASRYGLHIFGEPMLHKSIDSYIRYLEKYPVYISTNLNYPLAKIEKIAGFKNLLVNCSVDVTNPNNYSNYRIGGRFKLVVDNLRYLLKHGDCKVQTTFFKFDHKNRAQSVYTEKLPTNLELRETIAKFAEEYDLPLRDEHLRMKNMIDPWVGVDDQGDYTHLKKCHEMYREMFFSSDGYLVPCCNNFSPDLWMQHVSEIHTEQELLNGPAVRKFRRQLSKDKNVYDACRNCQGHEYYAMKDLPAMVKGKIETTTRETVHSLLHRSESTPA